jgi:hypothetical protein
MPRYAQAQPVRVSTEVRDTSGALVDPTSILLRVKKPDGTFLADYTSPTKDSTGKYHQDLSALDVATLGHYQYAWITTGTAAGVSPAAAFEVVDPFTPTHITFDDVVARVLNPSGAATISTDTRSELQAMMASAVSEQEQSVGAVAPRTVVETVYAHHGHLALSTRPVLSVVSATLSGSPVDITNWRVPSAMAGLVHPYAWGYGYGNYGGYGYFRSTPYVVTYTAGRNPVPQDLVEAALLRVQASYETQRSPAGLPVAGVEDGATSTAYPLILRAQDKERPYVLPNVA